MQMDAARIKAIVEFESDDPKILSLYLNVDSTQRTKEEYRLVLRSMFKEQEGSIDARDIEALERFFDFEYDGSARGVVIFSCQAKGLWEVFPLPFPVRDRITVARRAYLTPLQDLLEDFGKYGVVLVDRERARIFLFELGDVTEVSRIIGEEIKKHKQGGWAAPRLQRRVDVIAHQNFKEVVEATQAFVQKHDCKMLILAGSPENVASFRDLLPTELRKAVVGEISLAMDASEADVRDKVLAFIQDYVQAQEEALVEELITVAAKRGPAVLGLDDTLTMLEQERIRTLVISEGFDAAGAQCANCGYLAGQPLQSCPYCNAPMVPHEHVVNAALHRAVDMGLQVEIINKSEELDRAGHIGALLRY